MLRAAEERLHLPREVSTFVLTVGASANQNGTALYEGVTVLFLAQLFAVDLTLGQQLMLLFFAILAGVGTAGVPSGSICFVVLILQSIHVPPEGIAVILGVDRLLDMCRTVPNVTGDLVLATVVVRSEGADILRKEPPPPTGVAPSGPGSAALTPPSPWPLADGRTSLEMTPMALLRRLAGMVPPFRSHAIHHFGGFAAHASLRSRIVPRSPMAERCPRGAVSSVHLPGRSAGHWPRPPG